MPPHAQGAGLALPPLDSYPAPTRCARACVLATVLHAALSSQAWAASMRALRDSQRNAHADDISHSLAHGAQLLLPLDKQQGP